MATITGEAKLYNAVRIFLADSSGVSNFTTTSSLTANVGRLIKFDRTQQQLIESTVVGEGEFSKRGVSASLNTSFGLRHYHPTFMRIDIERLGIPEGTDIVFQMEEDFVKEQTLKYPSARGYKIARDASLYTLRTPKLFASNLETALSVSPLPLRIKQLSSTISDVFDSTVTGFFAPGVASAMFVDDISLSSAPVKTAVVNTFNPCAMVDVFYWEDNAGFLIEATRNLPISFDFDSDALSRGDFRIRETGVNNFADVFTVVENGTTFKGPALTQIQSPVVLDASVDKVKGLQASTISSSSTMSATPNARLDSITLAASSGTLTAELTGSPLTIKTLGDTNNGIRYVLTGPGTFTIDWGNGTTESGLQGTYINTNLDPNTLHTVKIDSTQPFWFKSDNNESEEKLREVITFPNVGLYSMANSWRNSDSLLFNPEYLSSQNSVISLDSAFEFTNFASGSSLEMFDTSNVTDMSSAFAGAQGDLDSLGINNWDTSNVTSMNSTFSQLDNRLPNISNWNVSNVTDMSYIFYITDIPDISYINTWDVSNVTTMNDAFVLSTLPAGNLTWNTQSVYNFADAFQASEIYCSVNLNTNSAIDTSQMFSGANIHGVVDWSYWNTPWLSNTSKMFRKTVIHYDNSQIPSFGNWNTSNLTNTEEMFSGFRHPMNGLSQWDVSSVTDMDAMFQNEARDNESVNDVPSWGVMGTVDDISGWDVSSVTSMRGMFRSNTTFNQDISGWCVSNIPTEPLVFDAQTNPAWTDDKKPNWGTCPVIQQAQSIQGSEFTFGADLTLVSYGPRYYPLTNTATDPTSAIWRANNPGYTFVPYEGIYTNGPIISMFNMFGPNDSTTVSTFNDPDVSSWDVSSVTETRYMFYKCVDFNQPLNNWDVSNVTTMKSMFEMTFQSGRTNAFNQDLSSWDVSSVTDMERMFFYADSFNQPLNTWDVSSVTNMRQTFYAAKAFNQPLNLWDVSNVTDMYQMFNFASVFNQDISNWCVTNIPTKPTGFDNLTSSAWTTAEKPIWGTCP